MHGKAEHEKCTYRLSNAIIYENKIVFFLLLFLSTLSIFTAVITRKGHSITRTMASSVYNFV